MSIVLKSLFFLLLFLHYICQIFTQPCYAQEIRYTAKVVKIIDGDSILVSYQGNLRMVRLYGVDSPEYGCPFADEAKWYVQKAIGKKEIVCIEYYEDTYKRAVVNILLSAEKSLNGELIKDGLAWVHPAYCKKNFCRIWQQWEKNARKNKAGLWREKNPVPPWQYKRLLKKGCQKCN